MSTSYSANLALALPATGELSGTWGTTVNTQITNMLDEALGYRAFSATGGADTLTIPDGTTGVARSIYIQLNGTGGGSVAVPATKTKMYFVFNNTASAITFKVTGQTGVSIPAAAKMALVSNGTDIIVAQNYFAALTLGAALPVLSGGTGVTTSTGTGNNVLSASPTLTGTVAGASLSLSSLTSGRVTYAGTAGLLQDSANLLFNGTTLTANTIGAFTLSGTVAGGGNQLNNVIIGTTTPLAGAFTTLSATTSGSIATLNLTDTGASGANLKLAGSGGTTPDKFIRAAGGVLQILNSAYASVLLELSDAGAMTLIGDISISKATPNLIMSAAAAGQTITHYARTAGVDRWQWGKGNTAESGSNAGSDYFMNRYSDAGAYLGTPFTISRATGLAAFATGLEVTGLLDISAATSGQIKFPATQNASANANTLDDYEEGTWTPSIGGTATYTLQSGTYTKVGRLVSVSAVLQINVIGTGSVNTISGLPFARDANSMQAPGSMTFISAISSTVSFLVPVVQVSTSTVIFQGLAVVGNTTSQINVFQNSARVDFQITYQTT